VSSDGETETLALGPLFACPNGITLGPDGAAYVVNFGNPHVLRVTAAGDVSIVATFPGEGNAHIVYAAGAFYVTRIATNEIVRVELNGGFARWAGTGAVGLDDGPLETATLARPNGIAVSADERFVYVNNIVGEWRGDDPTSLVIRKLGPLGNVGAPAEPEGPATDRPLESIELAVGELVFDALAAGPADGEVVFLLHGFPQTSFAFRHQLRALADAGYRAVAPDQRGYSPGARPADVAAYAMTHLVDDVLGMADVLGVERFHVVGHDWGGAVAWVTALGAPGRVQSLTVLSTPHFAALAAARADRSGEQASRSAYFDSWSQPGAETAFLADDAAQLRAVYAGLGQEAVNEYLSVLGEPEALQAALAWYAAAFGGTPAAAPAPPPPIRVPTLYVWSTDDEAFGRQAALATAQFVDGPYRFVVLEGVSHWIPELAPARTSQLILEHIGRPPS
jgi:pimeloyl-ACP methyl ester carboxylesterase